VPQEIAVYPDLTARGDLEVFGRFHGLRDKELRERSTGRWRGPVSRIVPVTDEHLLRRDERRVNIACASSTAPRSAPGRADGRSRPAEPERIFVMLEELRSQGTSDPADDASAGTMRSNAAIASDHRPWSSDRHGTLSELIAGHGRLESAVTISWRGGSSPKAPDERSPRELVAESGRGLSCGPAEPIREAGGK